MQRAKALTPNWADFPDPLGGVVAACRTNAKWTVSGLRARGSCETVVLE